MIAALSDTLEGSSMLAVTEPRADRLVRYRSNSSDAMSVTPDSSGEIAGYVMLLMKNVPFSSRLAKISVVANLSSSGTRVDEIVACFPKQTAPQRGTVLMPWRFANGLNSKFWRVIPSGHISNRAGICRRPVAWNALIAAVHRSRRQRAKSRKVDVDRAPQSDQRLGHVSDSATIQATSFGVGLPPHTV